MLQTFDFLKIVIKMIDDVVVDLIETMLCQNFAVIHDLSAIHLFLDLAIRQNARKHKKFVQNDLKIFLLLNYLIEDLHSTVHVVLMDEWTFTCIWHTICINIVNFNTSPPDNIYNFLISFRSLR